MNFLEAKPLIRLLIFDLDGTLVDSAADLRLSVNATMHHMGRRPLDEETIYSYVGKGAPLLIRRALGEGTSDEEAARGLRFFLRYYWDHKLDNTTLYPGARKTLEWLANGAGPRRRVLGVLTNKPVLVSRDMLEDLDLMHLFRFVHGGDSFANKKPHPEGIESILADTGIPASEAMIVGDSDVDIAAGVNAGIWTCGVTYGFGDLRLKENPPDLVVHKLSELSEALQGENPSTEQK